MRILFLFWIVISLIACDKKPQSMDSVQLLRMQEVRQKLKTKLGGNYNLPIDPATEDQLKRGLQLYPQVCGSCHGGRGDGGGKVADGLTIQPPSFTDPFQAKFFSDRARLYIIRKGITGTPMMGWEGVLNDQDSMAVFQYVRSLIQKK